MYDGAKIGCWEENKCRIIEKLWRRRGFEKISTRTIKNQDLTLLVISPHIIEEDHGDPAELLAKLEQSEAETAKLRDKLKAILEEALLR